MLHPDISLPFFDDYYHKSQQEDPADGTSTPERVGMSLTLLVLLRVTNR